MLHVRTTTKPVKDFEKIVKQLHVLLPRTSRTVLGELGVSTFIVDSFFKISEIILNPLVHFFSGLAGNLRTRVFFPHETVISSYLYVFALLLLS